MKDLVLNDLLRVFYAICQIYYILVRQVVLEKINKIRSDFHINYVLYLKEGGKNEDHILIQISSI
jgi:hypothetical protein